MTGAEKHIKGEPQNLRIGEHKDAINGIWKSSTEKILGPGMLAYAIILGNQGHFVLSKPPMRTIRVFSFIYEKTWCGWSKHTIRSSSAASRAPSGSVGESCILQTIHVKYCWKKELHGVD